MIVSLFSDASYDHDLRVGGWGAWVKSDRGMSYAGGAFNVSPANVEEAEGYALVNAVGYALRSRVALPGDRLIVAVDNTGVLELARRERLPSREWQHVVLGHLDAYAAKARLSYDFRHVKAHASRLGNRNKANGLCDRMARKGLALARERHAASPAPSVP